MILEMKVPSPGESITEVEIAQWLVSDGDYVEKDQAIAEVDSDKATLELPAEISGTITLKAEEGDAVEVGAVVCLIDSEGNASASKTKDNKTDKIKAESPKIDLQTPIVESSYAAQSPSPAAKKIMNEKGISINEVKGSGRGGRITKNDAVKAVPSMGTPPDWGERNQNRSKLSMLRRKVAERLVDAKNETAMLTTFNEVDMAEVFKVRNAFKDEFLKKHKAKLGFMSFFTKAVVRALKLYPDVNSMMDGDYKISYDYCDISVAVSGPKGLMVPVVRNAELLSFSGIEKEIGRLAVKARDGKITVDDMTGGTFTISNGGVFGSMLSTPIINPPQSGILGMHNIIQRPVAIEGKVEIRPMMYLALSYDHRIIDGKESVGFLVAIKEALENPKELLMDDNPEKAFEL
ncbi:MAG: 2-oxoglutarate dehydrogenase complex dihydrolipoyllysine-residue succinyltransferase [Flavobacteriaceae bacterium]|nr:2-oxoglutarate dehydrogenase complex dihydrolipoyllysine-residue succinyltransferase [Flavobacteriaceae bacterium]MDG2235449.1 2-oxoglutarate dehydrogenase complex dihydrolipoyllysine-residue succinyltransferase [Flavobacteriaceae bacterium]